MITSMNKSIQKNRVALIRYFYSLPEPIRDLTNHYFEGPHNCLCVKGQTIAKFFGFKKSGDDLVVKLRFNLKSDYIEPKLEDIIQMSGKQRHEVEKRYEGWRYPKHSFSQIADWLQTLPGWPRVL